MGGCWIRGAGVFGAESYKVMRLGATGLRGCKIEGTGAAGLWGWVGCGAVV